MPIHDWTRVEAGIFHDFHHEWISQIKRALNSGLLPPDYYALAEQRTGELQPDILTLRGLGLPEDEDGPRLDRTEGGGGENEGGLKLAAPRARWKFEAELESYRRKQRTVVVRHVSRDDVVAMVEIVSPGNKDSRHAFRQFVDKAAWLLDRRIHLLVIDLHPPTARDPRGIHGAIWGEMTSQEFEPPEGQPLTLASYESGLDLAAYVEAVAVGEPLPDMPLFLRPGAHVEVPLEATYREAFAAVPRRWRVVLEPGA